MGAIGLAAGLAWKVSKAWTKQEDEIKTLKERLLAVENRPRKRR